MQKVLKKIVSILFTLVLISSIGIVSSFAYQVPQNSETAVLKGNEHYSCSGKVIGTFKLLEEVLENIYFLILRKK